MNDADRHMTSIVQREATPRRSVSAVGRGPWLAVAITVAVIAGVTALAFHSAHRDRAALVDAFAGDQLLRLRIAIREIESELASVRQHLEFAARLVDAADSGNDQRRELEALLAVARDYRLIAVYDLEGRERVVAMDRSSSSSWSREPFSEALRETARAAAGRRRMVISEPLGDESPWHRAFAAPLSRNGQVRGALVILVDQKGTFDRLRLVAPGPSAKLVLLGPHGHPAPLTDPALTAALSEAPGGFGAVLRRMRAGHTGSEGLSGREAAALGLGTSAAIAVFAPIRTGDAGHWSVAVLDSTAPLESQEQAIVLRMSLFAAGVALALGALSVYLVIAARRAVAFQERLRTAEEIARAHERAEKVLENVPVAVVALDASGRISALNVASRERVPSAVLGEPFDAAFPEARRETVDRLRELVQAARLGGAVQRIIAQPIAIAGRECHFTVHAVPLAHPLPEITLLVVLEDVTELHGLSSQLLRAEKLATVGVLAAGIAHEVGTPLGVVRGRAEMLLARLAPDTRQAESARIIVEEIDRIARTIEELLDFSRTSPAPAAPVPFEAVAANVVELLAFEARTRKVSLRVEAAPGLRPLAANADQLKQVLVNLVLNAIHACANGGHVTIRGRPAVRGARATLEVVDDGAGIPDELRHRVFDPFFTTKKRGRGTGLGLTVAAQIIRSHGGEIEIESGPGRGTRVNVSWPLAAGGAEDVDGETARRAHSRGG
jgi:signal transduction histidine kinase